jgi:hypothetical protein
MDTKEQYAKSLKELWEEMKRHFEESKCPNEINWERVELHASFAIELTDDIETA